MNQAVAAPNLAIVDGRPVTTSLNVAEVFGKQHYRVLRAIKDLDVPEDFGLANFGASSYLNAQGKAQPMYQITRDGFTLLAMGFTGKPAMRFKLAYIAAFNAMESELLERGPAAARKRVEVNHSHLRATHAPGGLDIRYTLDLTKIVRRPSARTLQLLGRLTGIDLTDLAASTAEDSLSPVEVLAREFVRENCQPNPEARAAASDLHAAYLAWSAEIGEPPFRQAPLKTFIRLLTEQGYTKALRGGRTWIYGLGLTQGEVANV